jgi:hypothetical protein
MRSKKQWDCIPQVGGIVQQHSVDGFHYFQRLPGWKGYFFQSYGKKSVTC